MKSFAFRLPTLRVAVTLVGAILSVALIGMSFAALATPQAVPMLVTGLSLGMSTALLFHLFEAVDENLHLAAANHELLAAQLDAARGVEDAPAAQHLAMQAA